MDERKESKGITLVYGIPIRIPIRIQPPRQPDRVKLRELTQFQIIVLPSRVGEWGNFAR